MPSRRTRLEQRACGVWRRRLSRGCSLSELSVVGLVSRSLQVFSAAGYRFIRPGGRSAWVTGRRPRARAGSVRQGGAIPRSRCSEPRPTPTATTMDPRSSTSEPPRRGLLAARHPPEASGGRRRGRGRWGATARRPGSTASWDDKYTWLGYKFREPLRFTAPKQGWRTLHNFPATHVQLPGFEGDHGYCLSADRSFVNIQETSFSGNVQNLAGGGQLLDDICVDDTTYPPARLTNVAFEGANSVHIAPRVVPNRGPVASVQPAFYTRFSVTDDPATLIFNDCSIGCSAADAVCADRSSDSSNRTWGLCEGVTPSFASRWRNVCRTTPRIAHHDGMAPLCQPPRAQSCPTSSFVSPTRAMLHLSSQACCASAGRGSQR